MSADWLLMQQKRLRNAHLQSISTHYPSDFILSSSLTRSTLFPPPRPPTLTSPPSLSLLRQAGDMALCFAAYTVFPRSQASEQGGGGGGGGGDASPPGKSQIKNLKKPATTLLRSPPSNKVFEDRFAGIVCYEDEHGEVICEGYDEGPRYSTPPLKLPTRAPRFLRVNGFPAHYPL